MGFLFFLKKTECEALYKKYPYVDFGTLKGGAPYVKEYDSDGDVLNYYYVEDDNDIDYYSDTVDYTWLNVDEENNDCRIM